MNTGKHSLWLHYGLSAAIVLVTLLSAAWYVTDRFHDFFVQHQQESLASRAITVNQAITDSNINSNTCNLASILVDNSDRIR